MSQLDSDVSASPRLCGEKFVLAVDLGTGGPKVGLVSLAGRIAWEEHHAVATRHLPGGGAVQDAEEWWGLIAGAARRGLAISPHHSSASRTAPPPGRWRVATA